MLVVDLLYVEWGDRYRSSSLQEALRCVALSGAKLDRLVIADNKLDCVPFTSTAARQTSVIPGDNRAREFSGWDVAYRAIGQDGPANALLFVNDTFSAHRRSRMSRRLRIAAWLRTVGRSSDPELFGPVDPFGDRQEPWAFGILSSYISSYVFGMNRQAARRLLPFCQVDALLDTMLATEFSSEGLFTAALPGSYADRIGGWLLTPGNWHNAAPVTRENFDFFRLKAKSVLYEYALTSRAMTLGICVSDLFAGRGLLDRLLGKWAKWWMAHVRMPNHLWLAALHKQRRSSADGKAASSARSSIRRI